MTKKIEVENCGECVFYSPENLWCSYGSLEVDTVLFQIHNDCPLKDGPITVELKEGLGE